MYKIVIVFFIFLGLPTLGKSCTCFTTSFPFSYLDINDTLLINKKHFLIKGRVLNRIDDIYNKYGKGQAYNIKVLEYWPNDLTNLSDTLTIIDDEMDCAVHFQKDSTYLIGAYSSHRYLATSSCEGTGLFSVFKDEIVKLGLGKTPQNTVKDFDQKTLNKEENNIEIDFSNIIIYLILALSLFTNVFFILRKKCPQ